MDGTPIDQVATHSPMPDPVIDESTAEPVDLLLHKQQLIDAARSFDPLKPLRGHPVLTVAAAAVLGVVAASPAVARTVQSATKSAGVWRQLARLASIGLHRVAAAHMAAQHAAQRAAQAAAESADEAATG